MSANGHQLTAILTVDRVNKGISTHGIDLIPSQYPGLGIRGVK